MDLGEFGLIHERAKHIRLNYHILFLMSSIFFIILINYIYFNYILLQKIKNAKNRVL